jgi:hypothetical protein
MERNMMQYLFLLQIKIPRASPSRIVLQFIESLQLFSEIATHFHRSIAPPSSEKAK